MNKRKLMSSLFAGAMTLGMTLSVSPVFAKERPAQEVKAYLVKELNIAENGIDYENTFKFKFDLKYDGSKLVTDDTGDKTISIKVSNDDPVVAKNIFGEGGLEYTAAGIYTYEVTESQDGEKNPTDTYGLTCSDAIYQLQVKVANDEEGGVFVDSVAIQKLVEDNNHDVSSTGNKVNPNPDTGAEDSGFRFVNTYTAKAGTEDPDYDGHYKSTTISKTVTGDYGDLTKKFDFKVSLVKASTSSDNPDGFKARIYKNGKYVDGSEITLNYGSDNPTIHLAHDEQLRIYDLPAGTKYTVTETQDSDYTTKIDIKQNGETTTPAGGIESLTTNQIAIGVAENSVDYTNDFTNTEVNPTGIIINNLPFVLMVAIAGSGLALYVVSKRRTHQ